MPREPTPLAVLDVETTGTRIGHHEVIELCVIQIPGEPWRMTPDALCAWARDPSNHIVGRIAPQHPERIQPGAVEKNGYTAQAWARTAKPPVDVLTHAARLMESAALVAHNLFRFDLPMLRCCFRQHGVAWPKTARNHIDTLVLMRAMVESGALTSCSLAAAVSHFAIVTKGEPHRAGPDALACARVYQEYTCMIRGLLTSGRRANGLSREARERVASQMEAA